jgi:hypothetical protein
MYVIKRTADGMYVARPGSLRSYTNNRQEAHQFLTSQEAQRQACDNESIWFELEGHAVF